MKNGCCLVCAEAVTENREHICEPCVKIVAFPELQSKRRIKVRAEMDGQEFVLRCYTDFRISAGHLLRVVRTDLPDGEIDFTLSIKKME